jgi:isoamylase
MRVLPGSPHPLGATWDGAGVNFAVFSENATRIELCLFDGPDARAESHRIPLFERTHHVHHAYLTDILPGQLYGYRVYGPYAPEQGHRFNPAKVLLDPYAKAIGRDLRWADEVFGYKLDDPAKDLSQDTRDSAAFAPLGAVVDASFTWGDDRPPAIPWQKTVIYETHVKGATRRLKEVPEKLRGTYGGLASEAFLRHVKDLGVTALELMPVQHFLDDRTLLDRGLSNYWGYNPLSFFAPALRYASPLANGDPLYQFKVMVRAIHAAGLEVILDVVYNHTAEGNQLGPTLSLRGLDNACYYRLASGGRYYEDFTGCGNTPNVRQPRVLQLIMDSLRYWVLDMHVDGFRFDLASALARELFAVDKLGAFFDIIQQDPVLSRVKLIAEPWDVGEGGYQVGNFPSLWSEWNGKFRDSVRRFWKGDNEVADLSTRLSGSGDLYESGGRRPYASINFVTCHDGFTLQDLVTYNAKHNEANGEGNRDGTDDNQSWNCGVEGPAADPDVLALRERQKRNLLTTLILSQGVPMIRGGDELSQTLNGNNNGYCHDELNWLSWDLDPAGKEFLDFVRRVIQLRRSQPALQRRTFFAGSPIRGLGIKDVTWLRPSGDEMTEEDWKAGFGRCLGLRLAGHLDHEVDEKGEPVRGDTLLVLLNAHHEAIPFTLPVHQRDIRWERLIDTVDPGLDAAVLEAPAYALQARSVVVLRCVAPATRAHQPEPKASVEAHAR